jgi:hypothetical protein
MNYSPNQTENNGGLGNSMRAVAAILVIVMALFGALVVLDVIALDNAGEFFKKTTLLTLIVVLGGGLVAVLLKSGKR